MSDVSVSIGVGLACMVFFAWYAVLALNPPQDVDADSRAMDAAGEEPADTDVAKDGVF